MAKSPTKTSARVKAPGKRAAKRAARNGDRAPTNTPMPPPPPLVMSAPVIGMSELHQLVGVAPTTVNRWSTLRRERLREGRIADADRKLPPYDFPAINRLPAWHRTTIIRWAAETGKIENFAPWLRPEGEQWMPVGGYRRHRRSQSQIREDEQRMRDAGIDPDA